MEGEIKFYSKDIQILKQSQSKLVVEYVRDLGVTLTVTELNRVTDIFVEICLRPIDDELKRRIKELDGWLKDKQEKQKPPQVING